MAATPSSQWMTSREVEFMARSCRLLLMERSIQGLCLIFAHALSLFRGVARPQRPVKFQAEQELISIVPHFTLRENDGKLNFIGGDFGPFQAGLSVQVPLWLAITLKKRNKCRIIQPTWLNVEFLKERLEQERKSDLFEPLPFHYLEIASLLFKNASDNMESTEKIRLLIEDIQNIRQDKIRSGLHRIATDVQNGGSAYAVQMNNISALEISSVRHFMVESLNKFYQVAKLQEEGRSADEFESQSQSQSFASASTEQESQAPRLRRFR